jgi:hypothetical protein
VIIVDQITKPKDQEFLKYLKDQLPENLASSYFIEQAKKVAQDIRRMEWQEKQANSRNKFMRPDTQKRLVKTKLRNQAARLLEILEKLPDIAAARIDNQYLIEKSGQNKSDIIDRDDIYSLDERVGFTAAAREITRELINYCDSSYQQNNQGWTKPYKTQDVILALEFKKSDGDIGSNEDSEFFITLCAFRDYCQVEGYDSSDVSPAHINRILNELS